MSNLGTHVSFRQTQHWAAVVACVACTVAPVAGLVHRHCGHPHLATAEDGSHSHHSHSHGEHSHHDHSQHDHSHVGHSGDGHSHHWQDDQAGWRHAHQRMTLDCTDCALCNSASMSHWLKAVQSPIGESLHQTRCRPTVRRLHYPVRRGVNRRPRSPPSSFA